MVPCGEKRAYPRDSRFPLGSPEAVSRISEAHFSVQTGPILHPRLTEGIREARRTERFPVYGKGPQKTPTAKMHTPGHTSSHPPARKDTRNAHEKSCVRTGRSCAAHAAHTKPPCMVRGLRGKGSTHGMEGRRKPAASDTLGGGRPTRRASLPAGPAAGRRPSSGGA